MMKHAPLCFAVVLAAASHAYAQSTATNDDYASDWSILTVPGTWDAQTNGALDTYDGFAWYRCLITIPGNWANEDLTLRIENVDDSYEAFWNGTSVGRGGRFPPAYEPSPADAVDHTISTDLIASGNNLLAIRVFDHDGRAGFKGAAPVVMNASQGINLNGLWEFRVGDDPAWAKGPIAKTNTGIYWRRLDRETALQFARVETTAVPPEQALQTIKTPDDLELQLVLSEPEVRQPLFLSWDERGRLWVMQYLQYPYPAGLTMVSKDEFWRAVYDRLPDPPPHHFPGADKITIHEDTDGDGVLDSHKVFVEGLSIATSFAKGRGGVWVLNPPYLLFYPDADNDDVPDGDPQVHLQGFGFEDTHSVANSLRFGPDGWLYACQGSTVSGNIFRPGLDKPEHAIHSMGQLIWRYHPETRRYEIFAEGGGNSFGCEIDDKGRIYSGHNGGNTRGFHYVQGGYYQKGFAKHGALSNPYTFGYFPWMTHHDVPRFTHNFIIYEAQALPEEYRGKLFGVEPLQGQVVRAEMFAETSTFATRDLDRPVLTDDPWFRPVEIKVGPDGAIYIADMYEPQISHREHFSGQIDKSNGRIYRLQQRDAAPAAPFDLGALSTRELVDVLRSPNKWMRQQALLLIGDRKDRSLIPDLQNYVRDNTGQFALECLWALNLCGGFDDAFADAALDHSDPFVRLWTVRLLCDDNVVTDNQAERMAYLAMVEPYAQVRSQLASSSRRLPADQGLPIVGSLLARSEDLEDTHVPLLLWWSIESKAAKDRDAVLDLLKDDAVWDLPIVREHLITRLMRRYAAAGTRADMLTCARLFGLAPRDEHVTALMQGFEQALAGRSLATLPDELIAAIDKTGKASLVLQVRQGKTEAVREALAVIAKNDAPLEQRVELVEVVGQVEAEGAVEPLLELVRTESAPTLQMTALTALTRFDGSEISDVVAERFHALAPDVQAAALTLLSSRAPWSRALVAAVEAGKIEQAAVPLDTVRLMTVHLDQELGAMINRVWPTVEGASTEQMQRDVARWTGVLNSGAGDPYRGQALFRQSCGKCHLLFGDGGRIGPDLTSYQRKDRSRVLLNVVNPSAEVREGFETYTAITEDGRVLSGFLFDQDEQTIVLRGVDGQNVTIPRSTIDELLPQRKSLMPEGLLKDMSDEQVRDLFAYLQASQPLNN